MYLLLQYKKLIAGDDLEQITSGQRFIAGAAAGATSQSLVYPMEVRNNNYIISPYICLSTCLSFFYHLIAWLPLEDDYLSLSVHPLVYRLIDCLTLGGDNVSLSVCVSLSLLSSVCVSTPCK